MTATDELRRLLDERGVEYEVEREGKISEAVLWDGPIGTKHSAFVSNENPDKATGEILYATLFLTPEQAVAATLGNGECELEPIPAIVVTLNMLNEINWGKCSECGHVTPDESNYCQNCGAKVVKR